jgi:hypothetical protein
LGLLPEAIVESHVDEKSFILNIPIRADHRYFVLCRDLNQSATRRPFHNPPSGALSQSTCHSTGPVVRLLTMIVKPRFKMPLSSLPVVTFDELINPDSPITCYLTYLQSRQSCCQQPNSLLMTQVHWRRCQTVTGKQFFDT